MLKFTRSLYAKLLLNKIQNYPLLVGVLRAVPLANQTL